LFNDLVAVGSGAVLEVVNCEIDGLGLAGFVAGRQVVGVGEIELRQALRLGQKFPAMQLAVNGGVEDCAKGNNDDDPSC
jgi:hypothetical protein